MHGRGRLQEMCELFTEGEAYPLPPSVSPATSGAMCVIVLHAYVKLDSKAIRDTGVVGSIDSCMHVVH